MELSCILAGPQDNNQEPSHWAEWKLILGGSGSIVYMACTLDQAFAHERVDNDTKSQIYDISNSTIHISLNLKAVADAANLKDDAGTPVKIMADADQPVKVLAPSVFNNLDPEEDNLTIYLLRDGFKHYFTEHLQYFAAVFGVVLVSGKMGEKDQDFQWMLPNTVSYAIEHSAKNEQDYFGLLTMSDNEPIGDIQAQQVDIQDFAKLPKDANTVMIIDQQKFCKHVLQPSAVSVIPNSKTEAFKIIDDGLTVTNQNQLVWDNFPISDKEFVRPTLPTNGFTLYVKESSILIEITDMHYQASPGVTIHVNLTQEIKLNVKKKDAKSFVLTVDPYAKGLTNSVHASSERAKWVIDLELALGFIATAAACLSVGTKFLSCCITTTEVVAEGSELVATSTINDIAETDMVALIQDSAQALESGTTSTNTGIFSANMLRVARSVFGYGSLAFGT